MSTIRELKAQAKDLGVPWDAIKEVFLGLKQLKLLELEPEWEVRKRCYELLSPKSCHAHWWRQFGHPSIRFGKAFTTGDMDNIYGWDDVAAIMAGELPILSTSEDPAQDLFDMIKKPYEPMPADAEIYAEALDFCICEPQITLTDVPF